MKTREIHDKLGNRGVITEKGFEDVFHLSGNSRRVMIYTIKNVKLEVPEEEVKPNNNGHEVCLSDSEIAKLIKPYVRGMYNGV